MSHLTFLLLMLWVGVTVSTMVDLQKRMYGGKDCNKKERMYHVSLSKKPDKKPGHCGGSLISNQWILTAAHCKRDPMYAVVGVHPGQAVRTERIDKKDIIPHKSDDIMLLKLPNIIKDIDPVALPTCVDNRGKLNEKPQEGDEVQLAGHGYYKTDPKTKKPVQPDHLQCALFYVGDCAHTSLDDCYSEKPYAPQGNRVCFEETNVHPAEGDSGGGVIYDNKIYAVLIAGTEVCPKLTKGVSLRVCSYNKWITETINK